MRKQVLITEVKKDMGKHGIGELNKNEERLIVLREQNNLTIGGKF